MEQIQVTVKSNLAMQLALDPKTYTKVAGQALNDMAFAFQKAAPGEVSKGHHVRGSLVAHSFGVAKNEGRSLAEIQATAFSIARDRFSGWTEEYEKREPLRDRSFTLSARKGDIDRITEKTARAGIEMPAPKDFSGLTMAAIISIIGRHPSTTAKSNGLFIVGGGHGYTPGIYKIANAQKLKHNKKGMVRIGMGTNPNAEEARYPHITMLQMLKRPPKAKRKLYDWAKGAENKAFSNEERIWMRAFDKGGL
jgi:hypothetical protein